MSIQPGPGYTFNASSQGINLSIEQPWARWNDEGAVQQFQVAGYAVNGQARLKVAKGAVNYCVSQMPFIWQNPQVDKRQIWMHGTSVRPGISKTNLDMPSSPWMEDGGYYSLPGAGFYYVTICKPDFNGNDNSKGDTIDWTNSTLLKENVPFVSIFPSTSDVYGKIFSETGPSLYTQWTNIQSMSGYDAESIGKEADWGACHTTWFNPVKYGYACKIIATVEVSGTGSSMTVKVEQHVVGSIDLPVEQQFFGTILVNVPGWIEETDDPYNINENDTFDNIVNKNLRESMNSLPVSTAVGFYTKMLGPDDWTDSNYNLYYDCTGTACKHPFEVRRTGTAGDAIVWSICSGTVNNVVPEVFDSFTMSDGLVWLRIKFDSASGTYPPPDPDDHGIVAEHGTTVPEPTDEYGYIVIASITEDVVTQYVTGSLWSDRIKLGDMTAMYYFSRV